jgi:hypothetical protein
MSAHEYKRIKQAGSNAKVIEEANELKRSRRNPASLHTTNKTAVEKI